MSKSPSFSHSDGAHGNVDGFVDDPSEFDHQAVNDIAFVGATLGDHGRRVAHRLLEQVAVLLDQRPGVGDLGVGLVDTFVLALDAAQFLAHFAGARLESRVLQHLRRFDGESSTRKQGRGDDGNQSHLLSCSIRGLMVFRHLSRVMMPGSL